MAHLLRDASRGIAQEMAAPNVVLLGEDVAGGRRRVQATFGLSTSFWPAARQGHSDLGASPRRRRTGRRDEGCADRRLDVLTLRRRLDIVSNQIAKTRYMPT